MATVCPFRGITYSPDIDIDLAVSAPYDVISPEERETYKARHKNNFVNLILGDELPGDDERENRFTRAGRYVKEWLADGVLRREEEPVFYMYRQEFVREGRTCVVNGFIGAVKLCEYSENVILPHENTLSKPKGALEQTIGCTLCNLDCVYGLYSDPGFALGGIIDACLARPADIAAHDIDGNLHSVWRIADPGDIALISGFMADKQIAIADGHHRYETALKFRNLQREKGAGLPGADYTLMTLVNVYEKDLTVLPTHRVVFGLEASLAASVPESLEQGFETAASSLPALEKDMDGRHLGLICPKGVFVLRRRPGTEPRVEASRYTRELELTLLHKCILEEVLGITGDMLVRQTNVIYTRSVSEAAALVESGKAQMAFICNDIPVKAILDIASAGEKMPQKATYFYPKLLSGLVIRSLE
ncbi:MAG: DUF1015 domain-containing protein [Abditibacteriota bacterium]|nr:DUF1015 domain-containing protein [Abditibacteriota bacterium]